MEALKLTHELRGAGFNVEMGYSGNMKKRLQKADKLGARVALILGDEEVAEQKVSMKDLSTGEQSHIRRDDLLAQLKQALNGLSG